jgi:hypothetical protein
VEADPACRRSIVKGDHMPEQYYATVRWTLQDVLDKVEELGLDLSEAEAKAWLERVQKHIADRLVEHGWEVIEAMLMEDMSKVDCKFCNGRPYAVEAHYHDGGYVCPDCWDDRLKATE